MQIGCVFAPPVFPPPKKNANILPNFSKKFAVSHPHLYFWVAVSDFGKHIALHRQIDNTIINERIHRRTPSPPAAVQQKPERYGAVGRASLGVLRRGWATDYAYF
jgi:hypothetical protein